MSLASILDYAGAVISIALGLFALLRPRPAAQFVDLEPTSPKGVAEIRISWGGLYLGMGIMAFLLRAAPAFQMLGAAWLSLAVVRTLTIFIDRPGLDQGFLLSLGLEWVVGLMLVL